MEKNTAIILSPLVTILMPVYNAEKYIKAAIDSLLQQSYNNFEIIIVNDRSSDATADIVKQFSDGRIKLLENDINAGPGISLNKGIDHAKGEFIAIMHADDIAMGDRIEKQLAYFQRNTNVDIVGTQYLVIDENGNKQDVIHKLPTDTVIIRYSTLFNNCICHPTVMFRKKVFDEGCRYDPIRLNEDYALWIQCLSRGFNLANMDYAGLCYRVHQNQASTKYALEEDKLFLELRTKYRSEATLEVQAILDQIEHISVEGLNQLAADIRKSNLPGPAKQVFMRKLIFFMHDASKQGHRNVFNVRKYFSFLNKAGWYNFNLPVFLRLLQNGAI